MPKTISSKKSIEKIQTKDYTDTASKVGDFCIGFFGVYIVLSLALIFIAIIAAFIFSANSFPPMSFILLIILSILGIIISFKKGRRYIGIGIISSVIIPLLLFGACLIIINGAEF